MAGAFFNFAAGVVLILALFSQVEGFVAPVVTGYMPGAEDLQQTGLLPGDRLYRVDGHRIYFNADALLYLDRAGDTVDLEVIRDGARVTLNGVSMPVRTLTDANGQQVQKRGVYIGQVEEATLGLKLKNAWYQSVSYVRMVWMSLGDLITGAVGVRDMSGPIGIVNAMGEMGAQSESAGEAVRNILNFVAFIAINLAVMNLLPIPALDGGQILFLVVDGVWHRLTRRRINQKYLGYINMAGFCCLIGLMVVVAVSDVVKLF